MWEFSGVHLMNQFMSLLLDPLAIGHGFCIGTAAVRARSAADRGDVRGGMRRCGLPIHAGLLPSQHDEPDIP
jgi:hypothetical protein